MREARGQRLEELLLAINSQRPFQAIPGWNRRHSVELAISILKTFQYLHTRNIVLGDVHPSNILVWSEREVYFVDCDSAQVEEFSCEMHRPEYTHPWLLKKFEQGRKGLPVKRNAEHDWFSLAVVLFTLFLPGRLPYMRKLNKPTEYRQLVFQGEFPYRIDQVEAPEGCDFGTHACWTHLTPGIRECFRKEFQRKGDQNEVSILAWLNVIQQYREILADPAKVFTSPIVAKYDLNVLPRDRWHPEGV